jgi:hypothetical protein
MASSRESLGLSTRASLLIVLIVAFITATRNLGEVRRISELLDDKMLPIVGGELPTVLRRGYAESKNVPKTTVAYAVSITSYKKTSTHFELIDRAAVLHQSIKHAMQKSKRYDYHIYAFVHPEATDAKPLLERLGYKVQIRDTPFNISKVDNFQLVDGQRIGCCGEKEYIKLYSYLLSDYPVVVHLDLDTIVLRPMDDLFDFMALTQPNATTKLTPEQVQSFAKTSSMWLNPNRTSDTNETHAYREILDRPEQINFMYTRDYNMVDPPDKNPYQMGVQGGFLVIRPNQRDFDRMVEVIKTGGGGFDHSHWGFETLQYKGYGGFYGAATIQGLASYYYDHLENAKRSIELNRCHYNTMVDKPRMFNEDLNQDLCRTLEEDCEDCRKTPISEVYTSHFTVCGKPEYCEVAFEEEEQLCWDLLKEWHKTRLSLEWDWMQRFAGSGFPYIPELKAIDPTESRSKFLESQTLGHCDGRKYIPLTLPAERAKDQGLPLI